MAPDRADRADRPHRPHRAARPNRRTLRGAWHRALVGLVLAAIGCTPLVAAGPVGADPAGSPTPPPGASITVVLVAPGGADVAFTVTGQPGFVLDDDTDPAWPDRVTLGDLAAGTYTIAQAAVAGATLGALVCDGGDARTDLPARATTLTVAPGDQVTCTFTNVSVVPPAGATITVVLDAHDRQDFDVSVSGRGVITLDDDNDPQRANSARLADLAPGSYVVTQSPVPGWRLAALTCLGASVVDQAGATATVTLGAGDQVVCTFTMAPDRPLSGAIRWDAWHDGPAGRAVEHTLGPAHWHDRLPWFSEITGPGTVRTRADNQAAADREIEIADELGLDYFAFIVYDTDREVGSEDEGMMRGLKLYRQSALRDRVKYTVVIDGQRLAMPAERAAVLRYMQDPNWVYVDARPLVYVGLYSRPVAADVATLRAESLAQGTGDPYVVYMTLGADSPTTGASYAAANGIDAVSSYIMGVATSDGRPYADLATGARRTWDQVSGRGVAVVPTVMSGWDPRPRVERPPYWGGSGRNWYQAPTPSELATHLGEALDWARSRRSPAVVAYAWNEFDEGGWLAPTLRADDARQDGIRAALTAGTVPTLPRVSVDDASALEGTETSGAAPATLSFPVTLSVPAATPVTVAYAFTPGSALPGDDYVDEPGSVTFAPGQTVASIPLRVVGDAISDGDESVGVRLGRSVGAVVDRGRATGTLVDDDAPPRPAETFVSDLGWVSARNGFGPVERDRSNGQGGVGDGGKITVNGVVYDKGLGVHAASTVVFALRPGDARFVADVGVDDACGRSGTVVFRVLVDGVVRFQTARLTNQSATVPVSVDVTGGRQLTLQVTDGGDGAACDHADWAAARLLATTPVAPPAAVGAPTVSAGSATARVTWTAPAGPVTGYVVRYATTADFVGATEVSVPSDANAATIGSLTAGVVHFVQVRAVNGAGVGPWAPTLPEPVVPYTSPATPGDPVAGFTGDRVSLAWTAPHDGGAGVTGYEAQVSADAGTTWSGVPVEVQLTGGDAAGTGVAGTPVAAQVTAPLVFGVAQQFRVRAVNPAGPGPWSRQSAPVVPVGVPGPPVALTATPGATQVALRWAPAAPNGAAVTAYEAEVATDPAGSWRSVPVASDLAALVDGLVDGAPHWFRVRAVNAAGLGPFATVGPVVPGSLLAPAETFVSDLGWVSARNGFGPVERDRSNGHGGAGDGGPITVNGVVYDKGLGVHAASTVVFALRPGDARFVADVGVDDVCGSAGTVVFRVLVDGVVRFQTARLTNQSATVPVSVDVTGGRQLTLQVTDGGDGAACDHADWAAARLLAPRS